MPIWTHTYDADAGAPMIISALYIGGPYGGQVPQDSPSRKRVFVCKPATAVEETPCATKIVSTLARRAYRRPVTASDTRVLMDFYRQGRAQGDFDAGIRSALERLLASPDFLFRIERDPNRHVGFGYGEHFCLGAHLARRSQRALFGELARRVELLEPAGEPKWIRSSFVVGMKHLPVRYRIAR